MSQSSSPSTPEHPSQAQSLSSNSQDTHDPPLRHDVTHSFESISFHSPNWGIEPLPSTSYLRGLSEPAHLPPLTLGNTPGGTSSINLNDNDGNSEGQLDLSIILASPVGGGVTISNELPGDLQTQENPLDRFLQSVTGSSALGLIQEPDGTHPLGQTRRHIHGSPSGTKSERGAETWLGVAPTPQHRASPYLSPNLSPHPRTNELPYDDSHTGHRYGTSQSPYEQNYTPPQSHIRSSEGPSVYYTLGQTPSDPPLTPKQLVTTGRSANASHQRQKQEATFVCPIPGCGSAFTRSFNLKGHLRSHKEARPFVCHWPGCGKGFAREHDYKRHEQLHTSFRCDGCGKEYARKQGLDRHRLQSGDTSCLKVQGAGGSVGTYMYEDFEDEGMAVEAAGSTADEKEASTPGVLSSRLPNNQQGGTRLSSDNLPSNAKDPQVLSVARDNQTASQSSERPGTSMNQPHETLTRTLTTVDTPEASAVGDRVPFTLKSRHMARYVITMSAEQQESFDIEMAQRRLRERNARKAAAALCVSRT